MIALRWGNVPLNGACYVPVGGQLGAPTPEMDRSWPKRKCVSSSH